MKKLLTLTVLLLFVSQILIAQTETDSIEIRQRWYGWRLKYDGKKVKTVRQLSKIVKPDPVATAIIRKAKTAQAIGIGINLAGIAYATAYDIYWLSQIRKGMSIGGMNTDRSFVVIVSAMAVSFPFSLSAGHNFKKAVRTYNEDLRKTSYRSVQPEYYLSLSPNGIGLTVKF